ncbi:phosphatase PAP2 family protein [Streptomyces sp. SID8379]|uniref:phosphatase PAP2 family protein n=1 Tax=unclassified Streptomyces TaxID=2593676 RepID=UPI00036380B7|nr:MULTISPECIES: phosphatase PAP2 family protein [unclassified Streptomyces]MYW64115.1 phosphatase PAP2 family protein [Streptomyces sp. SID8379]
MSLAAPPHVRPRVLLSAGAALLVVPVLVGTAVRADRRPPFQAVDDTWLRWMGGPHKGFAESLASALNLFGGPYGALVPLVGMLVLFALRRFGAGLCVLIATLATQVAVQALKHLVDRPRPAHPLVTVDHGSFPSGHAATMAMTVVLIGAICVPARRLRWWWPVGVVLTLTMMWSRTWLHAHWLSDTLAGALAGAGATLLVCWAFGPGRLRGRRRAIGG